MVEPVVMRTTNQRDVSATLRDIADQIDASTFGEVNACVVVIDAFDVETFYCGDGEAGPNAHLLLGVGQHIMQMRTLKLKEEGKES
jgi:hypothetical protein